MVSAETSAPVAQSGKSPNSKTGSPSKEVEQSPEEVRAAAFATLASGKRHLLVSDIPLAVTTLGEACELLSGVFGETAAEMAEVYFYYGKALLELARLESGVLGNALDGDGETEEEDDEESADGENEEEDGDGAEKSEEAPAENGEKEEEDGDGAEKS